MNINRIACGSITYIDSLQLLESDTEKVPQAKYNARLAAWQAKNNLNLLKPTVINNIINSNAAYFLYLAVDFCSNPRTKQAISNLDFLS